MSRGRGDQIDAAVDRMWGEYPPFPEGLFKNKRPDCRACAGHGHRREWDWQINGYKRIPCSPCGASGKIDLD